MHVIIVFDKCKDSMKHALILLYVNYKEIKKKKIFRKIHYEVEHAKMPGCKIIHQQSLKKLVFCNDK